MRKPFATSALIIFLLGLLAVLPVWCASGQTMMSHPLPTQLLLPVAQVHAIAQTADGMTWYATTDGLCRDNGYQVDVFRMGHNDGGVMRSSNILCVAAGRGKLFFGTDEGLYAIDTSALSITRADQQADKRQRVSNVMVARDGSLFASMGKALVHLNSQMRTIWSCDARHNAIPLYEDRHGNVWMTVDGSLGVVRTGKKNITHCQWNYAAPTAICQAGNAGCFWIATYGDGIVLYDAATGKSVRQEATVRSASDSRVIDMLRDSNGLLWLSTMSGLDTYKTTNDGLERIAMVANMPNRKLIIDRLCEDRDGNILVSGFSPTSFIVAPATASVWRNEAAGIRQATGFCLLADRMVADGDGYYWLWQGRYGLALYHEGSAPNFIWDSKPQGVDNVERGFVRYATQQSAATAGLGIVAYTGNTVWRLWREGMAVKAKAIATVADGKVKGIRVDGQGRVWIATRKSLTLHWPQSGQTNTLYRGDVSLLGDPSADGRSCFFAKDRSVMRIDANGTVSNCGDVGEDITCIVSGSDGAAYVTTRQGHVLICDGKRVEKIISEPNGNTIKQIAIDNTGCLWTLTDQTVTRYNLHDNTFVQYAAGDADIRVDYFYGLEPEERGMGVTGAGAYCVLPTSATSYAAHTKATAIATAVSMPDTTVLLGSGLHAVDIPSDAASVTISLSSGEHLHASKVMYAWRYGENSTWTIIDKGNNRAFLGTLPKGDYDIYVKATDRYGNWGEPRLCVTLHRLPAWWETWWAWTLYIIVALAVTGGIVWLASRIWYLRRLQMLRQEMSLDTVSLEPDDVSSKRYDSEFTKALIKTIEDNISDMSYNVLRLADDMHTSRANLFRKCKALTGKNPTNLIKEIRLKAAATMLASDSGASVADIAAKTGFASASYFTKCFKEMFGVLPTDYRAKK